MSKMQKIPIFLAGITLATTSLGGNMTVGALSGVQQEILTTARETAEEFVFKTNAIDAYLKMNMIKYQTGEASGVVSVPEGSDWYIKKIVVAYMNFGQGVTEEEADQNLATLTGERDAHWNIVSLYESYPAAARKTQNIILNQAQTGRDVFANKSDILYFAVEFGEVADGKWSETWWSRGKIDYRSCVHSAVFDAGMMSCVLTEDGEKIRYLPQINGSKTPIEVPEDEDVITWEEEWQDIILADYEVVQNELELMWGYLNDGLWTLAQDDLALDGLIKSASHYSVATSRVSWIVEGAETLKLRIKEMKKFYKKNDGVDTSRVEILETENETLKQANTVLEGEKVTLTLENERLRNENSVLEQANEKLKSERSELEREILRLQAENEALRAVNDNEAQGYDKEQSDAAMSEIKSLRQEIERMTTEMMELRRDTEQLEAEKAEFEVKNGELEQSMNEVVIENTELKQRINGLETEKQELEKKMVEAIENMKNAQEMTGSQKCEAVSVVTEVKVVDDNDEKVTDSQDVEEQSAEILQNRDNELVETPNLGGEEVKTTGVWWWLIPVVGLIGVILLLAKRKFSRG